MAPVSQFVLYSLAALALVGGPRPPALAKIEQAMGPLPPKSRAPLNVKVVATVDEGSYQRAKITYEPEPGRVVHAWLLTPKTKGRKPAAVCLHQTTGIGKDEPAGLGGKPNLQYARELAERGWVAIAPDYPSFGDDHTDFARDVYGHGYASGSMYGIVNHRRAVDLLAERADVDKKRIVAIGHSLGGHNALFLAAFEPRIRAVVTSCGFTLAAKYYGGNLKGWSSDRYMPRISAVYHNSAKEVPFDFTDVLAAIAPRALYVNAPVRDDNFEVSGVDDVARAVQTLFPAGRLRVEHPDSAHDFPPDVRQRAYRFLERTVAK